MAPGRKKFLRQGPFFLFDQTKARLECLIVDRRKCYASR